MNSVVLLAHFFFIRYGVLFLLNKEALSKAAFFAPMQGIEKIMYLACQFSTLMIIIYMFFLKINTSLPYFIIALVIYILGVLLLFFSVISFADFNKNNMNQTGLYRFSRNPMYVAYFIYFLGCVFLTQSILLFIFQREFIVPKIAFYDFFILS